MQNKVYQFLKKEASQEGSVQTWKHDEARINKALLNLIVVDELPIENESFVEYTSTLNGKYCLRRK